MSSTPSKKFSSSEHLYQASSSQGLDPTHLENNVSEDGKTATCFSQIHTKFLKFGTHLSKLKLEMAAFLFSIAYVMTIVTSTSMIIDKVCLVHYGYPSFICQNLENFTGIKTAVEKLATNYQLGHSLLQIAPATILACFIGPWSDIYGRKFPIILASIGLLIDAFGSTICAYYLQTRVEYFFIPAIFTGLLGGPVTILAVFYSYASDSTQFSERTMKYAFIEMAAGFGIPLGSLAGGWIFKFLGYAPVYFFSTGGFLLCLIWVVFVLKETRGLDNDDPWSTKLRNIFSCKAFCESFIATVKERPHKGRKQVIWLILSMCFLVITQNSAGSINYLFVHHQFGWSNTAYSTITSIYAVFGIAILVIVVPVIKRFKVGDPYLGLLGVISAFGKNLGIGIAWTAGVYHLASLFGLLGGCANFAARSRISKVVSNEDLGKVFSFVAAAESLLPLLTTILMSQVFRVFLDIFPGMPYILLASFLLLPLGVFCWMICLPKMSYEDINHTTQSPDDSYASIET